jgi:superfamily II DNA/RNA helicase
MVDRGFAAAAVHGDLGQGAREQALRAFRAGKIDVLVATDVAARGIDVPDVTHVINYQCPDDESTFLHRIGRTGPRRRQGRRRHLRRLGRHAEVGAHQQGPRA